MSRLRPWNPAVALLAATAIAALAGGMAAQAAATVTLDASFGTGGSVTTDFARGTAYARAVAVQPDGKVLAVGGSGSSTLAAVRFNADGSVDSSYGTGGKLTLGAVPDGTGYTDGIRAAGLAADDTLIVGGTFPRVARLSASGTLDATFENPGLSSNYGVMDLVVQPDGKTVIVGDALGGVEILRYTTDGLLDATFSGDGRQVIPLASSSGWGVTIASDGDIVAVGTKSGDVAVVRVTSNGTPDGEWGTDGVVTTDLGGTDRGVAAVALPGGGIAIAGNANTWTPAVVAYEADGALDTAFAGDGIATMAPDSVQMSGLARDSSGALYMAAGGSAGTSGGKVWKFTSTGSSDASFGTSGVATTGVGGTGDIIAVGSKILVAGSSDRSLAVARLNASGTPDAAWSGDGVATVPFAGGMDVVGALLAMPDGGFMVGGQVPNLAFGVARYSPGGALDASFGTAGLSTVSLSSGTDLFGAVTAMKRQEDGKVVALGTNQNGGSRVVRYQPSGALDTGFSSGTPTFSSPAGNVDIPFSTFTTPVDIFAQPDQKLLVLGSGGSSIHLARFTSTGAVDATFDGDGMAQATVPGTTSVGVVAAVQQSDGKLVAGGRATKPGSFEFVPFVARLTAAGALDTTFSDDGVVLGDSPGGVSALAVDSGGRILTGGSSVTRYTATGTLDSSFSGDGTEPMPSAGDVVRIFAEPAGTVLVVSRIAAVGWLGQPTRLTVARFTSAGTPDTTFSDDGVDTTASGVPQGLNGVMFLASAERFRVEREPGGKLIIAGTQAPGDWMVSRYTIGTPGAGQSDVTPPTITISAPTEDQRVAQGAAVQTQFVCTDPGGSGVESCAGPATLDAATAGAKTFTVTAVDQAGNRATKSVNYVVDARATSPSTSPATPLGDAGNPNVTPPGTAAVFTATDDQIRSALSGVLAPSGKAAKAAALLKSGYAFTFDAPAAGKLQITWYVLPKGAKLAAKSKPLAIATGAVTALRAGKARVRVRINAAGRTRLKTAKSLKVTSKAVFAPSGKKPLSAIRTFSIKR